MNRENQAIEYFKEKLLNSEVSDYIAKIIVFGSAAKGNFKRESDIDILILGTKNLKEIEEVSLNTEVEVTLKFHKSIEPIIRCVDWLRFPQSLLAWKIEKYGKEVYKMDEKEISRKEAESYFDLADEYIKHAEYDLEGKIYRGAIEAAYNAFELCAKALLLKEIKNLPKTHSGVIIKFTDIYVKRGKVSTDMVKEIRRLLKRRNDARYEPHIEITREEAEKSVKFVKDLINTLRKYL